MNWKSTLSGRLTFQVNTNAQPLIRMKTTRFPWPNIIVACCCLLMTANAQPAAGQQWQVQAPAVVPDLAPPDPLQITPANGFAAAGGVGGPFTPASETFVLTNAGSNTLSWAVGDPASVPAGTYANLAFTELGITAQVQSKLVLCANVTQVLTTVASGNVDAGLVYSTDALGSTQVKVVAQAPADINAQIVYPEAVLSAGRNQDAAQDYLNYLSGSSAVTLFIQYGFTMAGK